MVSRFGVEVSRPGLRCLDAIYKVVDAAIARRLEEVARRHGLISANAFGFVKGGSTEWPISLVAAAQWHARETGAVLLQLYMDATSAYDTISHRGTGVACEALAMPDDVVDGVLVHLGGHSRVVNTAYGLGDESGAVELEGGCAQGAPGSPSVYNWTVAPARAYAEAGLSGYELLSLRPGRGDAGGEAGTSRGTLPQYADDDALMTGCQVGGREDAEAVAEELREAAERLAMGYAVAGVRNRHQKCILDMSPEAERLLGGEFRPEGGCRGCRV